MNPRLSNSVPALVRRCAKGALLHGLRGLSRVYRPTGLPIFCYHSIDDSGSLISVPPALFERQMTFLKDCGYRTVALQEVCQTVGAGGQPPRNAVGLTFDDGFRNNYSVAYPILHRLGFSATIFVTSGYVGKQMTWKKTLWVPDLELASWDELREMSNGGIDIQAHGVTHADLRELTLDEARQEIGDCKSEIESQLNKPVTLFAYPYGRFADAHVALLEELDFLGAVAGGYACASSSDGPFALKRLNPIGVGDVSEAMQMIYFECCARGTAPWYEDLKKRMPMMLRGPRMASPQRGDEEIVGNHSATQRP